MTSWPMYLAAAIFALLVGMWVSCEDAPAQPYGVVMYE